MNSLNEIKLADLKREIAVGVEDLDREHFQTYSDANIMQLADDIGRTGRIRLNGLRLKVVAKVYGKKK